MLCVSGCCGRTRIRDYYSGINRGELFYMTCPVKISVHNTIVKSVLQVFVFIGTTVTSIYDF